MPVTEGVLWTLGILSLFGLFFWVSLLLPATSAPRMAKGWSWLEWRPLPTDLPLWMGGAFTLGLLLQSGVHLWFVGQDGARVPVGVMILLSILLFQGLLTATFYCRLHRVGLNVPRALGFESPFGVRELVGGLVGYCMALPVVGLAAVVTNVLFETFSWEMAPQPLLDEFSSLEGWMNWVTLFVLVGFIGPLLEEVVFRGFVFAWLRQRWGIQAGLVGQAVLFALIHQFAAGLLPLFALSIVLGLAYVYTQRLMVCVWLHAIFNSITLINVVLSLEGAAG